MNQGPPSFAFSSSAASFAASFAALVVSSPAFFAALAVFLAVAAVFSPDSFVASMIFSAAFIAASFASDAFFPMYATTARLPLRGVDGMMMDLTETRELPGWILTPVPKAATTGKAEVRGATIVRDGEEEKLRSLHLTISV